MPDFTHNDSRYGSLIYFLTILTFLSVTGALFAISAPAFSQNLGGSVFSMFDLTDPDPDFIGGGGKGGVSSSGNGGTGGSVDGGGMGGSSGTTAGLPGITVIGGIVGRGGDGASDGAATGGKGGNYGWVQGSSVRVGNSGDKGIDGGDYGGGGGGGGATLILDKNTTVDYRYQGGFGGSGGCGTLGCAGAGGGGAGAVIVGSSIVQVVAGGFAGGDGGRGKVNSTTGERGAGGGGGVGVYIADDGQLILDDIAADVSGGRGYDGGTGGIGIVMAGNGGSVDSQGTVRGGESTHSVPTPAGTAPSAVLISGNNNIFENRRRIMVDSTAPDTDPIVQITGHYNKFFFRRETLLQIFGGNIDKVAVISGDKNWLEIDQSLDVLNKKIPTAAYVSTGQGNTFTLGGETEEAFDLSVIGPATGTAQIRGFSHYVKTGTGKWTLTGHTDDSGDWTVEQGILALSGTGNLESADAVVVSGTLDVSAIDASGTVLHRLSGADTGSVILGIKDLSLSRAQNDDFQGIISGSSSVTMLDGIQILSGDNIYSGGTMITSGTLQLGNNGSSGSIVGEVTNNGTLAFNRSDSLTFDGLISGSGSVSQIGLGTTILTADSTYTGGTTVSAGVLQIGDGHVTGSILGNASIAANTTLAFNRSDALDFDGVVSGAGLLKQLGAGALSLNGDSSGFTGKTSVSSGTLLVHGKLGGTVEVAANASLGGDGALTGDATLDAGGANLVGREGQVLTFEKDLTLAAGNNVNVALGAPSTNGLFHVKGHLTLDGTLNVTDQGGFGPGLYRIFDYDGTVTDNGLALGTVPGGDISQMALQTNIAKQINLVNATGVSLNFWNGSDASLHGNGTINGGDGVWNSADQNWTELDGVISGVWKDDDFAIFTGASGIVTVSNGGGAVTASGMQFSTDGYRLEGDALTLTDDVAPIIRVDKDVTATIDVELQGSQGVNKTDFGTLILTGENHYSGGTTVSEGILQLGDGGNSGSIEGDVVLARTAYDYGTLAFNRSDAMSFAGAISGEGEVLQQGAGTTTFTGNNSYSGGLTIEKGTAQAGIADTAFGSGRLTVNAGATVDLNDFNTTVAGLLNGKDGSGAVTLGTGTLTLNQGFDSTFSGIISGDGGLTKNGSGTLTFSGANIYNGTTVLNDGTLKQGVQGGFSNASAYITGSDGTLMLNGFDTAMVSLENSGVTDFGGTGGTTLSVTRNYIGNSGTLVLNTVLGDDSSKTDLLKIGGETSGTTTVKVNNRGGLGAQTNEGIRIITIAGQSNGQFNLSGTLTKDGRQAVVAGAYAYTLHQGGVSMPDDGDWYLRSERTDGGGPDYNPGAPVYEGYAQTLQALNKLPTLQQRVGNRYWSHAANPVIEQGADALGTPLMPADAAIDARGIWGRIEGAHNRFEASRSTAAMKQDIDTFIMQAGVDGQLYEGETGKLIGGITGQYGKASSKITSDHGDGKVDTYGWGLGGTLTWYDENGFYADAQAQAMWYDSDLTYLNDNKTLINENKGFGYGLSLEAGKRIDLDTNWSLTPQAQLVWSSVKFDTFEDAWRASVSNRNGDGLNARLGLSADYRTAWRDANGMIARSTVYGIVNLYQEFMSGNKVTVAGVDFDNEYDKTWGAIGAGGTYAWADDKYSLYGEGSFNASLSNFADSYAVKGTVGFKVRW